MSLVQHIKIFNLIAAMLFSRDRILFFTLIKIFASVLIVTAEEFNTQLYLTESVNSKNEQTEIAAKNSSQKKLVSEIFAEARKKFDLNSDVSAECKKDYELYKKHLSNASVSAVRTEEFNTQLYLTESVNSKNEQIEIAVKNSSQKKWVSQLFAEARTKFDLNSDVSAECKKDYELYKQHLSNASIWAVRMLESSQWPYVGIFSGITYHLGNWKECVVISEYNVTGKYCLVETTYHRLNEQEITNSENDFPDEKASVWSAIETLRSRPWTVSRSNLSWALCIPASCQASDIEKSLNDTLYPIFSIEGLNITVDVNPVRCSTNTIENYPLGMYLVCGLLLTLVAMVVIATSRDILISYKNDEKRDTENNIFIRGVFVEAFSIIQNIKKLNRASSTFHGGGINFLKLVYVCFAIYGHRGIAFYGYPKFNPEFLEKNMFSKDGTYLGLRGLLIADVLLLVSGFFIFYSEFTQTRAKSLNHVLKVFILRWARMIPVFLILALFIIYILPYLGEGPFWNERIQVEVDNCKTSFWDNFFAVSNIFNADKMCLYTSWYISVDVQLAIIGGILSMLIAKNQNLGIFFTILTYLFSIFYTFVVTYAHKYHAMLPLYMNVLDNIRHSKEFTELYVTTFSKCSCYILGFTTAIIARKLGKKNHYISNKQFTALLILTVTVKISILMYTPQLFEFYREYNRLENSLNSALLRTIFSIPDCVILLTYYTTGWGMYEKYFDLKIWVPIGRLLYSVFLVHVIIQIFHSASYQILMPSFGSMSLVFFSVADIILSFIAAFCVHLLVEAPITFLSKYIIRRIFDGEKKLNETMDVHRNGSIKGKKKICEKTEADNYETKGETRS